VVRTLITGMSAVGKSSVINELIKLGHRAVDLDTDEWSHLVADDTDFVDSASDAPMDWKWREPKVRALLSNTAEGTLFLAGTSTDQSRLYPLLDHIVLLTIPVATAKQRLARRTTNEYGKDPAELRRELQLRTIVEPLIRRPACLEIDTSMHPLSAVVTMITNHVIAGDCAAAWPTGQAESPRRSKPSR
jgi:broad-specificity NMP kinase